MDSRYLLALLLAAATLLFAVGVRAEHAAGSEHTEAPVAAAGESGEVEESGDAEERLLGVDVESTPLVVLAIAAGLASAWPPRRSLVARSQRRRALARHRLSDVQANLK